jgi:hypothetical protein
LKRLLPLLFGLSALLALFAGAAAAQRTNNPGEVSGPLQERNWESENEMRNRLAGPVTLPGWPKNENLIEFYVSNTTSFRFFIDAASVSVGADRIVRYTLIARSQSGVVNVSYEGIRCDNGTYTVYAYGRDERWSARESEWRDIEPKSAARWHHELRTSYFCQGRTGTIFTAKEGLDALRKGSQPGMRGRAGY